MNNNQLFEGIIMVRGKGIGFIQVKDIDETNDIVIETEHLGQALNGDLVQVSVDKKKNEQGRYTAQVVHVLERARKEFIGIVTKVENSYRFQPDDRQMHLKPIIINADTTHLDKKVVTEITSWSEGALEPTLTVTEVLGPIGDHETEMQAIIRSGNFSTDFPKAVNEAARQLHENQQQIFADALASPTRRDMREVETFTIDPADAKDFDDALSLKKHEDGTVEIGIHIADVSHYVTEGGHLDKEALERGTSVYLVDRVIPMLPEVLSNDLCSLRPNEDRLAFSAVFHMSSDGAVLSEWYGQTVIHSDTRLTYEEAQEILDQGNGKHHESLRVMMNIARQLRKKRFKNGAIAFEQPEIKFALDEKGKPIKAYIKHRTETMLMIEDYMLLANQKVATYVHNLAKQKNRPTTFVFRIHDKPDPEKIEELGLFVRALGYEFDTKDGEIDSRKINHLLKAVENTPEENLIKTASIRSMAKAIYTTKNIGHFGLGFEFYTHFTSPIRRYPDLLVHRILRKHLDGEQVSAKELEKYEKVCLQSSEREVYAVQAERTSIKMKQVEYLADKVGEVFLATITGVTDWGVYVQEHDSLADGMVHISKLGKDFFSLEKNKYRIKGERTGKTFRLGDEIKVKLVKANLEEKQLDFELA